ncbi:hypothetical protein BD779DRAFT_1701676 [Infundibulicybe gibba]|nr:hypothetical protein BD779DRAFT_1701676 [Infundibulicybe gibba]
MAKSHNLDVTRQICLCLQDIEDEIMVEDVGGDGLRDFSMEHSSATVIKSFFKTWHPKYTGIGSHVRRDIIAMRYLGPFATSFDQIFTVLECLIQPFKMLFHQLSLQAHGHSTLVEQAQGIFWQRAILFRSLLSEGRWEASAGIPMEMQNVSENLRVFTNEDLDSIFSAHPQDVDLPSHCWAILTSQLKPHELSEALRNRPPVFNFMTFLDSRFQIGMGVKYMCDIVYDVEMVDSFFTALYTWIERNPQDVRSFTNCQTLLATADSQVLDRVYCYESFRDFKAFLEEKEQVWQRGILFRNFLSEGRWKTSTGIPTEVQSVFKNLEIFTDKDLDSIFNALCAWIDRNPQHADLPSRCWARLTALEPHRLDEALPHHAPVRDFMNFLDLRFQMGDGVKYLFSDGFYGEEIDSFFTALYARIERNPQDIQSFVRCREVLASMYPWMLDIMHNHRSFCAFEAFLEARIARDDSNVERAPSAFHDIY